MHIRKNDDKQRILPRCKGLSGGRILVFSKNSIKALSARAGLSVALRGCRADRATGAEAVPRLECQRDGLICKN